MLQQRTALKHTLSLLSVGHSSTGRAAFTESRDTVFHSLVSSSCVYLQLQCQVSFLLGGRIELWTLHLHCSSSLKDRTGLHWTWLFRVHRIHFFMGDLVAEFRASISQRLQSFNLKVTKVLLVPSLFYRTQDWSIRSCVKVVIANTHLAVLAHNLMSCDSDILASVFLTRKAVRREAGLWAQHSVISLPICLRHWQEAELCYSDDHSGIYVNVRYFIYISNLFYLVTGPSIGKGWS